VSEPKEPEMIDMITNNPDPSVPPGSIFGVRMPRTCTEDDFDAIIEAIEFRRKCHNQGFDNLIEWLNMNRKNLTTAANAPAPETTQ
jgi:hypothetical protein